MTATILAIDTATEFASVALYQEEAGVLAESSWHTAMNHTVELMPTVVRVLESQSLTADQLDGAVVALGPGSFTGLRIGLSVAKGLCLSLHLPIVGIPTLDIVAYAHSEQNLPICAILQAGRGRICAAFYKHAGEGWRRATDYRLATVDDLSEQVREPTLFCGEIDESVRGSLVARLQGRATIASPASSLRRAGYLAELGWKRLKTSGGDDLANLEPLYLHHPKIDERDHKAS
jgi:tRNA threonylcarbamoyladenosine biosynthesis protein TsaB